MEVAHLHKCRGIVARAFCGMRIVIPELIEMGELTRKRFRELPSECDGVLRRCCRYREDAAAKCAKGLDGTFCYRAITGKNILGAKKLFTDLNEIVEGV